MTAIDPIPLVRRWAPPLLLVAIVAAIAYTRLKGLSLGLWQDEVVSATHYSDSPAHVFTAHYVPNDHMLFNLLAWVSRQVVAPDEVALRLPSVLPALAGVGLGVWWTWRRFGAAAGVLSAVLIGLSRIQLDLSRQARGYGLCFLAMTGVVVFADEYAADRRRRHLVAFSVFGLIGVLTLPVFVIPYALVVAVLLVLRCPWREVLVAFAVSGLVALVWYSPVMSDLVTHRNQDYGTQLPWHSFLTGPGTLVADYQGDQTALVQLALLVVVVASGFVAAKRDRLASIAILVVPVCGTFAVLSVLRFDVMDRFVSYLLVPVTLLGAIGLSGAFAVRPMVLRVVLLVAIIGLLAPSARGFRHDAVRLANRPQENFKDAAEYVNSTGIDNVVSNSVRPRGLSYYLRPKLRIISPAARLRYYLCLAKPPFVYIDHPFNSVEPNVRCLRRDGASPREFHQRARGKRIDVWVVRHRQRG